MQYIHFAVIAMLSYAFVPPLVRIAAATPDGMPAAVVSFYTNLLLVVGSLAVIVANGDTLTGYLTHSKMVYVIAGGIALTIGILSYYEALSLGPVSIVTPIFGLFLVVSSIIGFLLLAEPVTPQKLLAIGFAAVAIVLVTLE
jgi:EamA-like transporter family.